MVITRQYSYCDSVLSFAYFFLLYISFASSLSFILFWAVGVMRKKNICKRKGSQDGSADMILRATTNLSIDLEH